MAGFKVDNINEVGGPSATALLDATSRPLNETETKTDDVSRQAIGATDVPHPSDRLNPGIVALEAALAYEQRGVKELSEAEKATKKHLEIIDQLLDLSSELSALPEGDKQVFSDKMNAIFSELKEKGVDLLKGNPKSITKEKLIELKSSIGAHVDKSRTQVQQIFTKMQSIIQNMMSVNDSGKRMISEFTQLLKTITRNTRP